MKINNKFKLRNVAGETIIVHQGGAGADLTKIISLNSTARFLYEQLEGKEFSLKDVEKLLMDNYEVDAATAEKDGANWVEQLIKCEVITD